MPCYLSSECAGPCVGCRNRCCNPKRPRVCQKLERCSICPTNYPPCSCEPHPCYPPSCRRVRKCAEWPASPCGRPWYRPLGPPRLCYKSNCCPPVPDCPLPKAWPLPCYPRLFPGCKYQPPCCQKIYCEPPPMLTRDVSWCKPNCAAKCCA